jgi:hypothetical protein
VKNVPPYARVSKDEYREIRTLVLGQAHLLGFHETDMWNLVIAQIEERHALVLKKRRKNEITLRESAAKVVKAALEERVRIERERDGYPEMQEPILTLTDA